VSESITQKTSDDNDRYLDSGAVSRRYSDASAMTIWRWMNDPQIAFPRPVKLGNRANFWWLPDLNEWDRQRRAASKPGKPIRVGAGVQAVMTAAGAAGETASGATNIGAKR
jgi:predicted DNA-binding transcriptional regulator AlpA